MKTIATDDGQIINAIELTREQVEKIGSGHENVSVLEYEEKETAGWDIPEGYEVIIIEAEGNEPFGDILAELLHIGYDYNTNDYPEDTGYDTNADGVGINSTYAVVKK